MISRYNLLFICLFLIAGIAAKTQTVAKWGPITEIKPEKVKKLGRIDAHYYVLAVKGTKDLIIEKYDQECVLTESKALDVPEKIGKDDLEYNTAFAVGDKIMFLYEVYNKKDNLLSLYSVYVDKNNLSASSPKEIMSGPALSFSDKGHFRFTFSEDRTLMLFRYLGKMNSENTSTTFVAIDINGNQLGTFTKTHARKEDVPRLRRMMFTNDKKIILLKSIKKESKSDPGEIILKQYGLNGKEENTYSHKIKPYQKYSALDMQCGKDNQIVITGVIESSTGAEDNITGIRGVCYLRVNKSDFKENVATVNYFDKTNLYAIIHGSKILTLETSYLPRYTWRNWVLHADNSFTIAAEYNYRTPTSYKETMTTKKICSYNNIIALHLSNEGKLEWTSFIAKKQDANVSTPKMERIFLPRLSYYLALDEQHMYFIYNDLPENIPINNYKSLSAYKFPKKGVPVLATLDIASGDVTKREFTKLKEGKVEVRPYMITWVKPRTREIHAGSTFGNSNEIFIYGGEMNSLGGIKGNRFAIVKF